MSQKIDGKDPDSVDYAIKQLIRQFGPLFGHVFRTITADNGSEFAGLTNSLKDQATHVYYTHPYAAWERPTNERHNEMIRRFIPKGRPIENNSRTFIRQTLLTFENHLSFLIRWFPVFPGSFILISEEAQILI
ncbi:IS30 family transposase [Sporolactobacillus sp. THM19-2]|uniref:IS30 family transposase n=1 Tax=Sporolactobacillus sp. THM19-2 TaxID=2511171 RepID=UPI00102032D1|nr:IS30 family transposase [Sporolactobacillus sp. THM19-2]